MSSTAIYENLPATPERRRPGPDELGEAVAEMERPLVLRGAVRDWPIVRAGSASPQALVDYLAPFDQGSAIQVLQAPASSRGRFTYTRDCRSFAFERLEMTLTQLLRRLRELIGNPQAPALYAGAIPIPAALPDLASELDVSSLPGRDRLLSLWLGNRTRTAAHWDLPQNLIAVVSGRRRFTLFPISAVRDLYMGPLDRTIAGQPTSLVDFAAPDLDRFPRFARALTVAEVAVLEPGDALYLPSLWIHHAESLDDFGAMVNVWWRDGPEHTVTPLLTMLHAVLTLRDLPPAERSAWRTLFDYYIFQTDGDPMAHLPMAARGLFGEPTVDDLARLREYLAQTLRA